jgi:hypothetical protein
MALAILVACGAHAIFRSRPRWISSVALAALVLALIVPVQMDRRYARTVLIRSIDIRKTIEWKTAQWLTQHWSGERVMLSGSVAIWLTAFSDTPELWGFDQGTTDPMLRVAAYAIHSAPAGPLDAEASVLWLKALGVQAVGVNGPASTEVYKDFRDPKKFEGLLDPVWRDGDDVLYRVGAGPASLARVVPQNALVSRAPIHGLDVDPLRLYVAALDNIQMPRADFRWTNAHSAEIGANLEPGQVISVQMAWHKGWHATVNGRGMPVQRDAIGLMYVDPHTSGDCRIAMVYDGGAEMRIAHAVSLITVLLLVGASMLSSSKRRTGPRAS